MQASPQLCTIIETWFTSWGQTLPDSTTWADRHLSHQSELHAVGTDPSDWFEGAQAFAQLRQEMTEMSDITFSPGTISAYEEGTVGWGIARPTLALPNGKQVSLRWSAVFHQEAGQWKVVHYHASVGVPNEHVFGT